jgi:PAS domain S-box-containing protein
MRPEEFDANLAAFLRAVHPDDRAYVQNEYQASLSEKRPYDIEHRIVRKDNGEVRWVHERCVHVRNDRGEVVRSDGVVQDITERKVVENALRENEEKLRGLYELSPLGFALTNMKGQYIEFNESFRRICGYSEKELKTLDYWALTPKKYEAEEARQLESLARDGHYGPFEKEYVRRDGTLVPLCLSGVLVKDGNGQEFIWSIVEDITERKRSEEALHRVREELEARVQERTAELVRTNRDLSKEVPLSRFVWVAVVFFPPF